MNTPNGTIVRPNEKTTQLEKGIKKLKEYILESESENKKKVNTIIHFLTQKQSIPVKTTGNTGIGQPILGITPSCKFDSATRFEIPNDLNIFTSFISNAEYYPNENDEREKIKFDIDIFANAKAYHNILQHAIYYDYTMDSEGFPKINIYIQFDTPVISESSEGIVYRTYNMTFEQTNIIPTIDLFTIKTIEVFLIQGDPRTSRGTITTVTPPM